MSKRYFCQEISYFVFRKMFWYFPVNFSIQWAYLLYWNVYLIVINLRTKLNFSYKLWQILWRCYNYSINYCLNKHNSCNNPISWEQCHVISQVDFLDNTKAVQYCRTFCFKPAQGHHWKNQDILIWEVFTRKSKFLIKTQMSGYVFNKLNPNGGICLFS